MRLDQFLRAEKIKIVLDISPDGIVQAIRRMSGRVICSQNHQEMKNERNI
jgi:hypothetical protein